MGLTVLDAGVIIGVLDPSDAHNRAAAQAVRAAQDRGDQLLVPTSAYSEALVKPYRRSVDDVSVVDAFLDDQPVTVHPIDRRIGRLAAHLRAQHRGRLRLPDAMVLATALDLEADRVITTDKGWPDVGVAVEVVGG